MMSYKLSGATIAGQGGSLEVAPVLLALSAALLLLLATRWGIGVNSDSIAYLGLRPEYGGHGPLYGWLMRAGKWIFSDVYAVARWFNIALYTGTAALAWHVLRRATGSPLAAFAGGCLVIFSSQAVEIYSSALSEPLFVFLVVLSIAFISAWVSTNSLVVLACASLVSGLATLARYPGIALIGTGIIAVLILSAMPVRKRTIQAALFGAFGIVPIAAWMTYVRFEYGTVGGRELAFSGNATTQTFYQGVLEAARYLLPTDFPDTIRAIALLVTLGAIGSLVGQRVVRYFRQRTHNDSSTAGLVDNLVFVLVIFIAIYSSFIVLSVLVEPWLPISGRYIYPAYIAVVLLGTIVIRGFLLACRPRGVVFLVCAAIAGLVVLGGLRAGKVAADGFRYGNGYSSKQWRSSETIAYVNTLPASAVIYSNGYYALLYLSEKRVKQVPMKILRRLGKANPNYERNLARMHTELQETDGVVVYFDRFERRFKFPSIEELQDHIPLRRNMEFEDGAVYVIDGKTGARD